MTDHRSPPPEGDWWNRDWQLLLQLDTDYFCKMLWRGSDRLFFWITGDALKSRDFTGVRVVKQGP